jgi:UDP-N-acetylglucosamine:LPS N-acetylglucosamine transferase
MERANALAAAFLKTGWEVAFCAAKDTNYRNPLNVPNYPAPIPQPMGLPRALAGVMFPISQRLGVQNRVNVKSYEQVCKVVGVAKPGYFKADVAVLRKAIRAFRPDLVYSEFRLPAIIAARLEGVRCAATVSYPTQSAYAASPELSKGVRTWLATLGFNLDSLLDIFDLAQLRFVPSIPELEPFSATESSRLVFTGPFVGTNKGRKPLSDASSQDAAQRDLILVYMGNGSISKRRLVKTMREALPNDRTQVYIAIPGQQSTCIGNIHIASHHDFDTMLDQALCFVNHGGQNSVMSALLHGVPQLICPGHVFERRYNADSAADAGTALAIEARDFNSTNVRAAIDRLIHDGSYRQNAQTLGARLASLGGAATVVHHV